MATMREIEGPTLHGGVRSKIFFRNESGDSADEAVATQAEVVEYDDKGSHVFRTYLEIDPKDRIAQQAEAPDAPIVAADAPLTAPTPAKAKPKPASKKGRP